MSQYINKLVIVNLTILIFENLAEPCDAGQFLEESEGCQSCPADEWSEDGNTEASCKKCPDGKGVGSGAGTQESDCQWSKLILSIYFFSYCSRGWIC